MLRAAHREVLAGCLLALFAVGLSACDSSASKWGTVELDPSKPTFKVVDAEPEPNATAHDFGPFTLMLPKGWTVTDFDGSPGVTDYDLTGTGVEPGMCSLDVEQWLAGRATDDALANELERAKEQLADASTITNNSLGYVDWPGMPRMSYSRNHRDYKNAPSGEYLTFSTHDSSNTYTFGVSISTPEGDPADTLCYRVWTTLDVE